ncbi:1-deoxy-D-xylulose-5-phosphate synthase N-terminal domain-containing protein [Rhodovibrionaceae bacterium A322]
MRTTDTQERTPGSSSRMTALKELEKKALWLASWTIHNANHLRPSVDGLKVGGHQASSASLVSLMTALYFAVLRPEDRVAVKPHASPVFHAIQYLLGNQSREKLENFRALGGAQSYPSRTKDSDDVDFSTGSVGLGVAMTSFTSLVQDYLQGRGLADQEQAGRMVALVGDAELDEGNIFEALMEGWKNNLRNTWWVIDYNRQSLDGVVHEGLYDRLEQVFKVFGWEVVTIKYGHLQQAAFAEPGGEALRHWIDTCPNQLYSALTFQGGEAWREALESDLAGDPEALALVARRNNEDLAAMMANLGGHCLTSILEAFESIDHDRPVCFLAYTVKGHGLPLAGHKDNHAGLMTVDQMAEFQNRMNVPGGQEWEPFAGLSLPPADLQTFLDQVPFNARGTRRYQAAALPVPQSLSYGASARQSTQEVFGKILNDLARSEEAFTDRIVTTSPDVTVSTNLGGWVNRRGLFAREAISDTFRERKVVSAQKWDRKPAGQHLELGIAENNLFILLGALGLSHSLFGERLLPIGTLYDPFIQRGLDALNYACYQDARFMVVATPSGVTLGPEGGAHQSISTPLIGMAQDGLASFEPAFGDELAAIMAWSFDYMQRNGEDPADEQSWLRDEKGGAVYLRLSTRSLEQPQREMTAELCEDIIQGGYWLRKPGPSCKVAIVCSGAVTPEAIEATGMLSEDRRDVGLLVVTSADRLNAGWQAAGRARERGQAGACSHVDRLLGQLPKDAALVTALDGHPATLSWLGGVCGQRVKALGVEHFGQSGNLEDLYRVYGLDAQAILSAVEEVSSGRRVRHLWMAG